MGRRPSHAKPKKKSFISTFIIIILVLALLLIALSNIQATSEPLKQFPVIGELVNVLDFTESSPSVNDDSAGDEAEPESDKELPPEPVRLYFDSGNTESGAPAYMIRDGVSPRRLELTLYNVRTLDMEAITQALSELEFVKDVYRTIVLDDSTRCFTVELSKDVTWEASEYNSDGYIDLTLTETGADSDDILYIVRSSSDNMGEGMASLAESVSDFSPSIVKTQSGEYCVVAGACSTEDEADSILEFLDDDFFIEECSVFSNPE